MQIGLGGGQAKLLDGHKAEVLGTYEKSVSASIGVCPGMVAFINNHFAVEFNVECWGSNTHMLIRFITRKVHRGSQNRTN